MQVTHLSFSSGVRDGGISVALSHLVDAQRAAGLPAKWLTADSFPSRIFDGEFLSSVQALLPSLIHIHGLWRSPTRIASRISTERYPLVIAPHGMLDPGALSISNRKKKLVWHLWERSTLGFSSCLHALCKSEAVVIRSLFPHKPIAIVPNGVEIPGSINASQFGDPPWAGVIPSGESVLLFLGRLHQKKGLDPLLRAWHSVASLAERKGFWLAIVGYGDNGALAHRVKQAQVRGELQRVHVFGPVFGAEKAATLASATSFVLPSFSEGLPMAALEAMAYQRPCLLSTACNLPEAFRVEAALPAEPEPLALSAALERCFKLSHNERTAMGRAGQDLVRDRFSWPQVASQTRELYSWVLGGGAPPAFVDPR